MKWILFLMLAVQSLAQWTVKDKNIYYNNKKVNLKGINWFGFETQDFVINGLWQHPMEFYMDLMHQNDFNVLRIPFSEEWIRYNFNLYPDNGLVIADPNNQHKKSIEIMDRLFDLAEERGMLIMLDLHRIRKEQINNLWYIQNDPQYSGNSYLQTWFDILDRYANRPNLFAADLLNEPHDIASWGTGNPSTDFDKLAGYTIEQIADRYSNETFLFFVEGINWGKDLTGVRNHPIVLPDNLQNRLVYSAHNYGPSVVWGIPSYDRGSLYDNWYQFFGYIMDDMNLKVVPGEWGGRYNFQDDITWMNTFRDYMIEKGMTDNFYWSLGPNSGDVEGLLLNDWTNINQDKLNLINSVQTNPTVFTFTKPNLKKENVVYIN